MSNSGDSKVQYQAPGMWTSQDTYSVDSNTTNKVTKTMGVNLSSDNDFSIDVPTKGGGTQSIRPDTVADLEKAAKKMLDPGSNTNIMDDGPKSFKIVKDGKQIGEI